MNDLAEKALDGLETARRELRAHPMLSLAGAGFVVGALVVVTGGQASAARADRPLTSWFGLQDVRTAANGTAVAGSLMLTGVLTLAVLWIAALWVVTSQAVPLRRVWWVAGAWAAPFALGPPLMDTSVDSYVAYGRLLRAGHDPYRVGPSALGNSPIVAAIDPTRRNATSAAGPLGSLLQHLVVSVGNGLLTSVVVWRVIAVLTAIWIARTAAELASRFGAAGSVPGVLAACALNPLLLLYVVSSPHLDSVLAALVLAAVLAAAQRRWWRALILSTLGATVGGAGFVAVAMVAAAHWFGRRRARWRVIARDVALVAITAAVPTFAQPDGWGALRTLRSQFSSDTPYSLVGGLEKGLSTVVPVASYDDLAAAAQVTTTIAALCVVGYLLATVRQRQLGLSVGYALLWVGLLAPVLHPWYLVWGVFGLLAFVAGQARIALVGVSVAACVLEPQGFAGLPAHIVTGACLAVLGLLTASAAWLSRPRSVEPPALLPASADTR